MRIVSGDTSRRVYFVAVDATDLKTRETGLSGFDVYRTRDGAAPVRMGGTADPDVIEIDATVMPGVYALLVDEDTTLPAGINSQEMAIHVTHAEMAPVTRSVEVYRPAVTVGETLAVAGGVVPSVGSVDNIQVATDGAVLADLTGPVDLKPDQSDVVIGAVANIQVSTDGAVLADLTGPVVVGTNLDKDGYSLAPDQSGVTVGAVANIQVSTDGAVLADLTGPVTLDGPVDLNPNQAGVTIGRVAEILVDTDGAVTANLTGPVVVGTNLDKDGYNLAPDQSSVTILQSLATGTVLNQQVSTDGAVLADLSGPVQVAGPVDLNPDQSGVTVGAVANINVNTDGEVATEAHFNLDDAAANKIADHVLKRGWQAAADSADGDAKSFRSLLGAVAKLVNKLSISGSTLTITETDDTTVLGTQAVTSDPNADPITGLDTT